MKDRLDQITGTGAAAARFWARAEADRMDHVREAGRLPPECGPRIVTAPARGPVVVQPMVSLYPDGAGGYVAKMAGHQGWAAPRCADSFAVMSAAARRRGNPDPFTPAQVAMGRHYAALFERHGAAGVRCSSVEARRGGSGGDGGFIDAVLADGQELDRLRARIGAGIAKDVRRVRPSVTLSRSVIFDRRLVDMVCLEGATVSDVMRAHGWGVRGALCALLQAALGAALDRMAGPVRGPGILTTREGPLRKSVDS